MCVKHYLDGAYYPVGGSAQIAARLVPTITKAGGGVFVGAPVTKLLLDQPGGAVVGVEVAGEHHLRAAQVVSSAGARYTFGTLLPMEAPWHFYALCDALCDTFGVPTDRHDFRTPFTPPAASQ